MYAHLEIHENTRFAASLYPGNSRCLDAFIVALSQACEGPDRRWYASTLELQLASLDFCRACRSIPRLAVTVGGRVCPTPKSLWISRDASKPSLFGYPFFSSSRVPGVRALRLKWSIQLTALVHHAAVELTARSDALELSLGRFFNQPVIGVLWPSSLQKLSFGHFFNQPIAGVVWPASLQQLLFGALFNQPVAGVVWPDSLLQLSFGDTAVQSVVEVAWPAFLQQSPVGNPFKQVIAEVVWPASLQHLSLGDSFNEPIAGVVWPSSLLQLLFGCDFK